MLLFGKEFFFEIIIFYICSKNSFFYILLNSVHKLIFFTPLVNTSYKFFYLDFLRCHLIIYVFLLVCSWLKIFISVIKIIFFSIRIPFELIFIFLGNQGKLEFYDKKACFKMEFLGGFSQLVECHFEEVNSSLRFFFFIY